MPVTGSAQVDTFLASADLPAMRSNLGLGATDNVEFATVKIGAHTLSDTADDLTTSGDFAVNASSTLYANRVNFPQNGGQLGTDPGGGVSLMGGRFVSNDGVEINGATITEVSGRIAVGSAGFDINGATISEATSALQFFGNNAFLSSPSVNNFWLGSTSNQDGGYGLSRHSLSVSIVTNAAYRLTCWHDGRVEFPDGKLYPNLPTADPGNAGQLWNDAGTVKVSSG